MRKKTRLINLWHDMTPIEKLIEDRKETIGHFPCDHDPAPVEEGHMAKVARIGREIAEAQAREVATMRPMRGGAYVPGMPFEMWPRNSAPSTQGPGGEAPIIPDGWRVQIVGNGNRVEINGARCEVSSNLDFFSRLLRWIRGQR
jgi:hypothetical protein